MRFENELLEDDYQGNAVINYTEREIPFTRIIEHKHFEFGNQSKTIITKEFPMQHYNNDDVPYYPINTARNNNLYEKYKKEAENKRSLVLGGRLATYKYLDMDEVILSALNLTKSIR